MVILLEPVCHAWAHEIGNAGFLNLVERNCKDDILFIGDGEHIKSISKVYKSQRTKYIQIVDLKSQSEADNYELFFYYFKMINYIVQKYHPKQMFLLCAYRPCILAAEIVAVIHKSKMNVLLHGMVEEYKGNSESYKKLIKLSVYCHNLNFLTYNFFCNGKYWKVPDDKVIFINHPYIKKKATGISIRRNEKIIIGIIGACANSKAYQLINCVNNMGIEHNYEFWIASRFGENFKKLPCVQIIDLEFDRKKIEKLMGQMDYLLLPYGKKEYALSASGVFWDAVSNKVPCLMLNSPYFEYYQKYKVGYRADSIYKLAEIIRELISHGRKTECFFEGMEELDKYNDKIFKKLLT